MAMSGRNIHNLPPKSAGASFSTLLHIPDRERCRPCFNTNKRQAMPDLA